MPQGFYEVRKGLIPGLRLPANAWEALHRAGITTIDQLRAAAGSINQFDGIGVKTAQTIHEELAHVAVSERQVRQRSTPSVSGASGRA
jgi:hypothetical protein